MEDGVRVVIEIREAENVRTNQQNKLWWSWMNIIADELGYSKQEIHDILKYKFLLLDTCEKVTHCNLVCFCGFGHE